MSQSNALVDALRDLRELFEGEGLRWYVFGAQAVVVYGEPRMTADLDITLEGGLDRVEALIPDLGLSGFDTRAPDPSDLLRRARVLPLAHRPSGLAVDLVVAGPGLEEEFLANRRTIDLAGVEVPIISPEDLIVSKILAGRPKDIDDVRGILRERKDDLDLDRARHFLSLLEQALGRSDLLSALDRLANP